MGEGSVVEVEVVRKFKITVVMDFISPCVERIGC